MEAQVAAFAGLVTILTVTPGADTALVTKNTVSRGYPAAVATTLGICSGLLVHASLSAVGLSAILTQSALLFEVVKLVGAVYLVFLGVHAILHAGSGGAAAAPHRGQRCLDRAAPRGLVRSFGEGVLSNVLNPKPALFYLTALPQFIAPTEPVLQKSLLLAGLHALIGVAWLSTYAYLISCLVSVLARPNVRRTLERFTGMALIGLGVRLAVERR